MNVRYRLWRYWRGVDDVPGEDGEDSLLGAVRVGYRVEPVDVGGRRWRWEVWLEFDYDTGDWGPPLITYRDRDGGPHEVNGRVRDRGTAEARARAAVADARRRVAAGQTLRNAREAAHFEDVVEL